MAAETADKSVKMRSIFVTGFGPFGEFESNPSERLVRSLDLAQMAILPVSFHAVDRFAREPLPPEIRALVMTGVAPKADKIRLERTARNRVSNDSDIEGVSFDAGVIHPAAPQQIVTTLFSEWPDEIEGCTFSDDAGTYLCNYAFFQCARLMPNLKVGFVHVPPFEKVSFESSRRSLIAILDTLCERLP
jgi:pyrrolidone-carboxylate peptidase